ncbi:MAG: hypothetical protein HY035_07020 [Nitrospirae bacterium]|nr:hypothetical protein [Nitrospirota bacterium]MBI3378134.1 hypothetical protein [Nitrospirota bacterium]
MTPLLEWMTNIIRDNAETALAALFGTFLGAFLAFYFERRHADKKEREAQISAAKHAQFVITTQLNAVKNMKKQVLDPMKDDINRHLTLKPFSVLAKFPSLDIASLVFMLDGDSAQLLNELMISEHKFRTLLGALDQRNERHEIMQKRMATLGPEATLDGATVAILKDMTDSIYGLCDDALKGLQESFEKLKTFIEKKFNVKALSLEFVY